MRLMVQRDLQVMKGHKAKLGLQDLMDQPEIPGQRELQVHKDLKDLLD
jgi:hypothetical protein